MPRVVARVNNPKNEWMFNEMWGVDVSVSTPHLLTALVEEAVSVGSLVRLLVVRGRPGPPVRGHAGRRVAGRRARTSPSSGFPRDSTVVAILRDDHVVVPRGDTVAARRRRGPGPHLARGRSRRSSPRCSGRPASARSEPRRRNRSSSGPGQPMARNATRCGPAAGHVGRHPRARGLPADDRRCTELLGVPGQQPLARRRAHAFPCMLDRRRS